MTRMDKNNYIQNKGLRTVFIASVLVSVINQLNSTTDGIIVNHLVTADAMSAISIASPIMAILCLILGVLCSGATILVSKELGMQHYDNVKRTFTVCMLTSVTATVSIMLCILPWIESISGLLTSDKRLLPLVTPYLRWSVIGSACISINTIFTTFISNIGMPQLVSKATIVEFVSNIILDLLLVGLFNLGIAGAAMATALSLLISAIYLLPTLIKNNKTLAIIKPQPEWFFPTEYNTIKNGIPSAVGAVCMAATFIILNALIQKIQGADGMFILSISLQMMMMSSLVIAGAGASIEGIGGVLLGEGDIDSYRSLVNGLLKKVSVSIIVITVILMFFPDLLSSLFGASRHLQEVSREPLRVMCLVLLPLSLCSLLDKSYLLQGHHVLPSVIVVLILVCVVGSVSVATVFCPQYLWDALPLGLWLMFAAMMLCTIIISRRNRTLHWFTLISQLPNDPSISVSVEYNRESLQKALDSIHLFINICDLPKDLSYKIDSCLEELTYNLISMTDKTGKEGSFDLRVVDTGEKIMVVMKDDGIPYNPVLKFNDGEDINPEEENIALVMLNAMCPEINHQYMNGINCTYMNFPYKS